MMPWKQPTGLEAVPGNYGEFFPQRRYSPVGSLLNGQQQVNPGMGSNLFMPDQQATGQAIGSGSNSLMALSGIGVNRNTLKRKTKKSFWDRIFQ